MFAQYILLACFIATLIIWFGLYRPLVLFRFKKKLLLMRGRTSVIQHQKGIPLKDPHYSRFKTSLDELILVADEVSISTVLCLLFAAMKTDYRQADLKGDFTQNFLFRNDPQYKELKELMDDFALELIMFFILRYFILAVSFTFIATFVFLRHFARSEHFFASPFTAFKESASHFSNLYDSKIHTYSQALTRFPLRWRVGF